MVTQAVPQRAPTTLAFMCWNIGLLYNCFPRRYNGTYDLFSLALQRSSRHFLQPNYCHIFCYLSSTNIRAAALTLLIWFSQFEKMFRIYAWICAPFRLQNNLNFFRRRKQLTWVPATKSIDSSFTIFITCREVTYFRRSKTFESLLQVISIVIKYRYILVVAVKVSCSRRISTNDGIKTFIGKKRSHWLPAEKWV